MRGEVLDDFARHILEQPGEHPPKQSAGDDAGDRRQDDVRHQPPVRTGMAMEMPKRRLLAAKIWETQQHESVDAIGIPRGVGHGEDRAKGVPDQCETSAAAKRATNPVVIPETAATSPQIR